MICPLPNLISYARLRAFALTNPSAWNPCSLTSLSSLLKNVPSSESPPLPHPLQTADSVTFSTPLNHFEIRLHIVCIIVCFPYQNISFVQTSVLFAVIPTALKQGLAQSRRIQCTNKASWFATKNQVTQRAGQPVWFQPLAFYVLNWLRSRKWLFAGQSSTPGNKVRTYDGLNIPSSNVTSTSSRTAWAYRKAYPENLPVIFSSHLGPQSPEQQPLWETKCVILWDSFVKVLAEYVFGRAWVIRQMYCTINCL